MTGVLANNSGQPTPQADAAAEKNGAHVEFNEQTNYVPKRTIITVSVPGNKQYGQSAYIAPRSS
jgi:hypothetical protein